MGEGCWNLLIASLAPARISDGGTRRCVYMYYLVDVDTVYNRSYHRLYWHSFATKPPDFFAPLVGPASRISIKDRDSRQKVFKQTRNSSNSWHSSRTWTLHSAAVTPRKFFRALISGCCPTNTSPVWILYNPWYSFLGVAAALTSLSLRLRNLEVNYYHDLVLKSSQSWLVHRPFTNVSPTLYLSSIDCHLLIIRSVKETTPIIQWDLNNVNL